MKGFPGAPDGPLGLWYRRVNETVTRAAACTDVEALVELLGEPDAIDAGDEVVTPSRFKARLGSRFRFGEEGADHVLTWHDPYRPRRRYRFGVQGRRVNGHWIETVDD